MYDFGNQTKGVGLSSQVIEFTLRFHLDDNLALSFFEPCFPPFGSSFSRFFGGGDRGVSDLYCDLSFSHL
jgi:hypothetical protein